MQADAAQVPADPAADLEELEPQRVELHPSDVEPGEPAAERGQEPVDGDMQEQPEVVGTEGVVAQAIGKAAGFEVLDPELGSTAPLDIPGVQGLGRILPVG